MKLAITIFLGFCFFSTPLSAREKTIPAYFLIDLARSHAQAAKNSVTVQEKMAFAKKGEEASQICAKQFPREAGCYFYRAVNTGLHIQAAPGRYQKKLKNMIRDCERVLALNDTYDAGGAYRILGNIYLKVPSFSSADDPVMRDVDKAHSYAREALKINSDDPENHLLMGEVFVEKENWDEARDHLKEAIDEWPSTHQTLTWYDERILKEARILLRKAEKKLTKRDE